MKVRLVTYRYANVSGAIHTAEEKLLEKWRCLGNSVLSSMGSILMFICLSFASNSIHHCLGSYDGRGFSNLLQHALLYLLLLLSC